jgi:hypothetical protein
MNMSFEIGKLYEMRDGRGKRRVVAFSIDGRMIVEAENGGILSYRNLDGTFGAGATYFDLINDDPTPEEREALASIFHAMGFPTCAKMLRTGIGHLPSGLELAVKMFVEFVRKTKG